MIDEQNSFGQPVKNDLRTYDNIQKIATGQRSDKKTGCLLNYTYFKKYYQIIVLDLYKQQALDPDSRAIQQINLNGNLD